MNVKQIIRKYLIENNFDGLVNLGECGCEISDLAPCMCDSVLICEPAYKGKCVCGDGCGFDMYVDKPSAGKSLSAGPELSLSAIQEAGGMATEKTDNKQGTKCQHTKFERRQVMDMAFNVCRECGHQWKC